MCAKTLKRAGKTPIIQFSVFIPNRMGCFHNLITLLSANDINIIALTTVDTTDSAIIRFVVDDVEQTRQLLKKNNILCEETEVLGVELASCDVLKNITRALLQAEINIHYVYPFLMRPNEQSGLIFNLEDTDLAREILKKRQIKTLLQSDISR